jgi:hypothetical protein
VKKLATLLAELIGRAVMTYCLEFVKMERETGFEPATSTLARLHSTN